MNITLNGERRETTAQTLAQLLEEAGFTEPAVATAVNGTFVARTARAQHTLTAGDSVEVLAPMQGG